ncbi:UV-stimulated scaffold protein A isoform X2 [Symphalangus syndactylus]|uniref:UV-stimulated scaffold protein A isoform X2 n=1 Tax=Symphalangus syndactylus TaxID=9590 RepID=UPI0024430FE8|nr:UV-stimulated scaffold protein A isoform X2 [Symphalangus syndactylus]
MDQKLSKLVEELTTSGEPRLNPEKMKELKKICKSSEEQLSRAYRLLIAQLTQEHAEIRLSAFQIVEELFVRSHQFRMLVVSNFQEFLELTLGTDPAQPLPPPREAAQRLRQATTRAVEGWNEKFGEAYKKLALGYHFLRHNKKVDFQDTNARSLAERKREEEKQKHLDKIYQERARQAEREMQEMSGEIESCLTEVESCFRLLVPFDFDPNPEMESLGVASGTSDALRSSCAGQVGPSQSGTPDPWDGEQPCCSRDLPASAGHPRVGGGAQPSQTAIGDPSDEDEDSDLEEFVRSHGLGSHKYTLDVELCSEGLKVQENEDNLAVLHAARDILKLIRNKFLPAVCSWIQRFTRVGTHGGCLKRAIDLKAELELALRKYKELDIEPEGGQRRRTEALGDAEEDEDDEDFVEVPEKEGYEPHIPDHLRPEYGLEAAPEKDTVVRGLRTRTRKDEEASDPTSAAAQLRQLRDPLPPPSSASPSRALPEPQEAQKLAAERARAPVVPYGVDLHYWGQELPTAGKILKASLVGVPDGRMHRCFSHGASGAAGGIWPGGQAPLGEPHVPSLTAGHMAGCSSAHQGFARDASACSGAKAPGSTFCLRSHPLPCPKPASPQTKVHAEMRSRRPQGRASCWSLLPNGGHAWGCAPVCGPGGRAGLLVPTPPAPSGTGCGSPGALGRADHSPVSRQ